MLGINERKRKMFTPELIKKLLNHKLPGNTAHQKMLPQGRSLDYNRNKPKESAVMIILFYQNNQLQVTLTRRNRNLRHHPGQISFPGGQYEKEDLNLEQTAIRETWEEVGINIDNTTILGKLSTVYVSVSNFNITPYICFLGQPPAFKFDTNEVEEIIIFPLNKFYNASNHAKATIKTNTGIIEVPCYKINDCVIWGATSMILAELEVLLETHYSHREEH